MALPLLLWHLGRRGGGPRYTLELARSLMDRPDVRLCLALSRQSEMFEETAALGLPVLAIDTYRSAGQFAAASLRLPSIRRQIAEFIASQRLEVALCSMVHLWNPLLVGPIRRAGALNALVVHDAAPHPGDNHLIRNRLMRNDFRLADLLVSLTDSVAERLTAEQGLAPAKIIRSQLGPFRYGASADIRPRRLGASPFQLLFFGRLLPYKGLDLLIDAMRLLAQDDVPVQLRLVGQGPLDLGDLPGNVTLERGWIDEAEVPSLFAACDLVVLPYIESSQSGVLPIASHLALPALVTPVGGLLQQVEQGRLGFVADEISAAGLARKIRAIFQDSAGYESMSQALAARGSDGQWQEIADRLVADLAGKLAGRSATLPAKRNL
jgi:glycosyltransferase involved in cell wall biosynthesis